MLPIEVNVVSVLRDFIMTLKSFISIILNSISKVPLKYFVSGTTYCNRELSVTC